MRSMLLVMSFIFLSLSLSPVLQCQEPAIGGKSTPSAQSPGLSLDERYKNARSLEQQGKLDEALKEYLWIFDNSRDSSGYAGVRLSFLLGSIAKIGKQNPAALQALRDRRAANEKTILEGKPAFDDLMEFTAISKYLGEPDASRLLYAKVKAQGPSAVKTRRDLMRLLWQDFARPKQYLELADSIRDIAYSIAFSLDHARLERDFPRESSAQYPGDSSDYENSKALSEGALAVEAALALKRADIADPLIRRLLEFRSDGAMYAALIQAALNAGDKAKARDVFDKAKASLPATDRESLSEFEAKVKN